MSSFIIYKASNGYQYWNLKVPNGEVTATSEKCMSKQAAENGVDSVQLCGPAAQAEDATALQRRF